MFQFMVGTYTSVSLGPRGRTAGPCVSCAVGEIHRRRQTDGRLAHQSTYVLYVAVEIATCRLEKNPAASHLFVARAVSIVSRSLIGIRMRPTRSSIVSCALVCLLGCASGMQVGPLKRALSARVASKKHASAIMAPVAAAIVAFSSPDNMQADVALG